MNSLHEAMLMTLDTFMYIPLIFFCFIPVIQKIKITLKAMIFRIILSVILFEIIFFMNYLYIQSDYAYYINTLLCIILCFWLYQRYVDLDKFRLLFIFMTACLIGGFGFLTYHIAEIFFNPTGTIDESQSVIGLFYQILFEFIMIVLLSFPTKKYIRWLVLNFHKEIIWRIIWIFPMIFTFIFNFFIPYDNRNMYIGRALQLYLTAIIILVIIVIVIYVMFYLIAYNLVENERILEQTLYLKMETEQYRMLQNHVEDTNRIRHDLRHQLMTLSEMLRRKEYKQAGEHLESYQLSFSKTPKYYCSSIAINAIINHYVSIFEEEHINHKINIRIQDDLNIEDIDFCVLLGNLLENALFGCRSLINHQREINLKVVQTAPHMIALIISNTYTGIIQKDDRGFLSSRHKGEGQGLRSVSFIAEKYHGVTKVTYTENVFTVKVLIHV